MAQGKHSSIRVALAVPPKIHEQLSAWADYEGRPLASLCMYLIEERLRTAQREGLAPSLNDESVEGEETEKWSPQLIATNNRVQKGPWIGEGSPVSEDMINEENEVNTLVGKEANQGKYIKAAGEMTKKEKLLTAISEALFD